MVDEKRGNKTVARAPKTNDKVGLPYRPFLFTLDQVAGLINVPLTDFKNIYLYYEGRSTGLASRHMMLARNIAPPQLPPDWRIAERELLRWMKLKGFHHYESTVATH